MSIFDTDSQIINSLRLEWGKDIEKKRDFTRLRDEYELVKSQEEDTFSINDQTWHDLEMDQHFVHMDRTKSYAGSLMMYKMLRDTKLNKDKVSQTKSKFDAFRDNRTLREEVGVALYPLKRLDLEGMLYFLDKKLVFPSGYKILAYIMTILPLLSIIGIIFYSPLMVLLLSLVILANFILNAMFGKYLLINKNYFFAIRALIQSASKIGRVDEEALQTETNLLKELSKSCQSIVRKSSSLELVEKDPIGIVVYIDMMFMVSMRAFFRVVDLIFEHREDIKEIYKQLGTMDALIGMASYTQSIDYYCVPVFTEEPKKLRLIETYQPLIKSPVPNSISVEDGHVYLTGSNMSGKSTFLRTVGLNVLMAQTFGFAFCREYQASFMRLLSSISRNDNLLEGKSYFLAEAEIILDMIKVSNNKHTSLIIIDEIFRGTNTKERIEASVGVLNYLANQNTIVFVATHDLEIKDRTNNKYTNYHFGESVGAQGIEFDYKLKEGTIVVGNALKILKFLGYPEEMFESR